MAGYPPMTFKTRFQYLLDKANDIAQRQFALNPSSQDLPTLFYFTDPARTPHPEDIAAHLPQGCGIIYRHFGDSHAPQRARLLRKIADERGLTLFIGEDVELALDIGADGVHLREHSIERAADLHRNRPELILTAACHDLATLRSLGDQSGLKAVFVSPVFDSQSPSASGITPLGVKGVQKFTEIATLCVYGLGGINCDNIGSLRDSGLSGIGAVDAFSLAD